MNPNTVERFRKDGFVNAGPLISPEDVDILKAEVLRVIDDRDQLNQAQPVSISNLGKNGRDIWQIVNIWQASPAFEKLIHNKALIEMITALTGQDEWRIWHDQIQYKPVHVGSELNWHQDSPLWSVINEKDQQITAWIALDDAEEDNGCMHMVPGSHLWGDAMPYLHDTDHIGELPTSYLGHSCQPVLCPVQRGHVHFHHSLTWHSSGENKSQRPRRAIAIHMMSGSSTFKSDGHHVMKNFISSQDGEKIEGGPFSLLTTAPDQVLALSV